MFRYDGPFVTFLMKLGDMVILHVLWLICCLPLVTAGASTAAAHYVALRLVRDEGSSVARMFFKSFRANLVQGSLLGIASGLVGAVLIADLAIFSRSGADGILGLIHLAAIVFLTIVYAIVMLWVWAILASYKNTLMRTVANAFLMAAGNWGETSMMVLQDLVLAIAAVVSFAFLPQVAVLFAIFGCPLFFVLNAFHLRRALDRLRFGLGERRDDE